MSFRSQTPTADHVDKGSKQWFQAFSVCRGRCVTADRCPPVMSHESVLTEDYKFESEKLKKNELSRPP